VHIRSYGFPFSLLVGGLSQLFVTCGGDPPNPLAATAANHPPLVQSITLDPATVAPGGSASVLVSATDPDGDAIFCRYQADHGSIAAKDPALTCAGASYVNDRGPEAGDTVHVTATDSRNASASASAPVRISQGISSTASPTPPPAPPPSPVPQDSNPIVRVQGNGGSCHPCTSTTGNSCPMECSVPMTADASDPDGDQLSFTWSGCASGSGRSVECRVTGLGPFKATVSVSDGRGGEAMASATAIGVNQTPALSCSGAIAVQGTQTITEPFGIADDDFQWSCSADVTGAPARINSVTCSQVSVTSCDPTQQASGCTSDIHVRARDPFGAVGSCSFSLTAQP
jgi:hypothetical protein